MPLKANALHFLRRATLSLQIDHPAKKGICNGIAGADNDKVYSELSIRRVFNLSGYSKNMIILS